MDKIKNIKGKISRHLISAVISPLTRKVSPDLFKKNYTLALNHYKQKISDYNYSEFIMPEWLDNMRGIEKYFLTNFSFSFLNHKIIKHTMFFYTKRKERNIEKKLIKKSLSQSESRRILREYNVGKPLLSDVEYATSSNSIHQLYHLLKFSLETKANMSQLRTAVEVGGGYGNMARIFKAINPKSTYIIIDIPIFSYIQSIYLKTILGNENVVLISDRNQQIVEGKINIIPLDKENVTHISEKIQGVDLFLSMWALSESNQAMQNFIKNLDYFKAKYLMFGYQKSNNSFGYAEEIQNINQNYKKIFGAPTEYVDDSFYLFCEKIKK